MLNKKDKLDYMIAIAAMKCAEDDAKALESLDVSDVEFDKSYYKKRDRIIRQYKRKPFVKALKVFMVRAAIIVMALMSAAFLLIGCVPELRRAVYNAIVEWYDEYITIRYDGNKGTESETTDTEAPTESESQLPPPTKIEEVRKPRNLPEGVWGDVLAETKSKTNIDYYYNEEYLFSFSQTIIDENDKYVDNEDVNVNYIDINGNVASLIEHTDKQEIYIYWNDQEYFYQLFTTSCSREELINYARSVE